MSRDVSFLELGRDYAVVADDVEARFKKILSTQCFVLGPETEQLERTLQDVTGASHAVACSSGSDALYLALLGMGIGRGNAVLVPSFTFFATAGAVWRAGARPIFVDVNADTGNVDVATLEDGLERFCVRKGDRWVERSSGDEVRALVAVHLYGRAVEMRAIGDFATREGLEVIEDAAQAIGAAGDVRSVGAWGRVACFSFYPTKNVGAAGDAGAVTTCDEDLARRLNALRVHGGYAGAYEHDLVGINARIDELQAAYINAKCVHLEHWTSVRGRLAKSYVERFEALVEVGGLRLPPEANPPQHVYHQFVVWVAEGRDRLVRDLKDAGIDSRVFYPRPLHLQKCFVDLGYQAGDLPNSERAAAEVLALPIHPHLDEDDLAHIVDSISRSLSSGLSS